MEKWADAVRAEVVMTVATGETLTAPYIQHVF
jgi:hypothetical protein